MTLYGHFGYPFVDNFWIVGRHSGWVSRNRRVCNNAPSAILPIQLQLTNSYRDDDNRCYHNSHIRIKNVDYRTTAIVASFGGLGSVVGSLIFQYLTNELPILKMVLGLAFLYVSIRMIYEGLLRGKRIEKTGNVVPGKALTKALIGFGIGILTGIIGLGGGYALVPSFIYLLESPVKIAVGTSLTSFISMAVISGGFKIIQGIVDVVAALSLGAGTAVGAQIGARLVPKVPAWLIKLIFGIVFLYVSLKFILDVFGIRI